MITFKSDDIIAGCRKNNRKDQSLLFEHFKKKVFGICLRYASSTDEAKDLQQETFIKIFTALQQRSIEIQSLESWIHRITVNTAIDFFRKQKRLGGVVLHVEEEQQIISPEIFEKFHEEDLIRLIQGIPDPYRAVFNLYVIDGLSHKEISTLMGITESTSRSYLTRAKEFLKAHVLPKYYAKSEKL